MPSEADRVAQILMDKGNMGKDFVQRILNPQGSPVLDNGDGTQSTHSMAWASNDFGHHVYPTVVRGPDGKLIRLPDADAYRHAMNTGESIRFDSPEDADWFARRYKAIWGQ